MRCPKCNHLILKQMLTPYIYYRNEQNLPIVSYSYEFTCPNCKRKTILSKKQFEGLDK